MLQELPEVMELSCVKAQGGYPSHVDSLAPLGVMSEAGEGLQEVVQAS